MHGRSDLRKRILCCFALLPALAAGAWAQADLDPIRAYRQQHGAEILAEFAHFLTIPNVASDTENIHRTAEHIRDQLSRRGVRAELWELAGAPPIVYGELETPGATRTVGIYMHYDGQPVDAAQWTHPPWEPKLYTAALEEGGRQRPFPEPGEPIDPEWRIYARSAGDDKAPLPAILTALDALREASIPLTSHLKFFFEGEEEAGSVHLGRYMLDHRDRLDADVWLICDGPVHQSRRPQLVFGVRGYVGIEITVYGASRYLHSGHYGNWAPNPAMGLAQLLAGMKDEQGNVLIEGFYDSTVPVGEAERRAIASVPDYDDELRRELGLAVTEKDNAPLIERMLIPTLNVHGMVSATVGATARNIIPTIATASVDIRLAKGNDPEHMLDLVEAHIRKQGYHIVREDPDRETRLRYPKIAKLRRGEGYRATRTSPDLPIARQVSRAAQRATPEPMVLMPTLGGSLPLYLFTEILGKPLIIAPIANHDDNQHAPDENLRLANLWYGIDLMGALFTME
ncbi:MAG: M20/M25/M40 family metallo-hydrolase [bacterium]|nr:M20/M25/M40 family metallo-hydrolase [bacterium]